MFMMFKKYAVYKVKKYASFLGLDSHIPEKYSFLYFYIVFQKC